MRLSVLLTRQILTSLMLIAAATSCQATDSPDPQEYIPLPPDYSDEKMWVSYQNDHTGDGIDVFYIPSTWEYDYTTPDGRICHYADPSVEAHRDDMKTEIDGIAGYMGKDNNFYSPYYRHISLDSWATLNEDTINRRFHDVAFQDVKRAFGYFLESRNQGRPFVLAGFSQGGKSVVELLKILAPQERERLVAAYVMGYKVTPDDVAAAPWIKGARASDDTGVVISYNSVSDVRYIKPVVAAPTVMCINPGNWRTDDVPAELDGGVTVAMDPQYNVLVVTGYDGSALPNILGILNVGDYHGAEPWLYSDCLSENLKTRIRAFRHSPRPADPEAPSALPLRKSLPPVR